MEMTAAELTISDKGSQGLREDRSGPAVASMLQEAGWRVVHRAILPDEYEEIRRELLDCCGQRLCLVVTTGGTGFSKRDVTPEATLSVVEWLTPGIPEAMRAESIRITPHGMLSREAAGIREDTLIINLPGSVKACRESMDVFLDQMPHAIQLLRGIPQDCGRRPG